MSYIKKIIFIILVFISFYSISSCSKYSDILEYNFLEVNIVLIENTIFSNNSSINNHEQHIINGPNIEEFNEESAINSSNQDFNINSDIFIDTNTNFYIEIHK